jgi:hypothetical protein
MSDNYIFAIFWVSTILIVLGLSITIMFLFDLFIVNGKEFMSGLKKIFKGKG